MKIKINNVIIEADHEAKSYVTPKYYGDKKDIMALKNILQDGARGMYGNGINIDYCLWVDFLHNVKMKFPEFEFPKVKLYNPQVPKGAMP
ncbi:hypothetical protein WEU38_01020 [Cyanobacterium aponinum AL20118]|uniref:Uncharacterized protein n=1 Tax=Cyanobacterium aponinum AL20115 TaxID=3090662 RepID=A0AAF1C2P0_9CHRO|nr:hypothetical protein [Cyanobacterium aponinum]PHV61572.1 hypothetical protein CSQ80_14740 [Cyanobacterium aponinum IPPAS B-1201]WPF88883.1 hypothetical protein SAY89_01025 [Cyanobacterium aponinum AL20115]